MRLLNILESMTQSNDPGEKIDWHIKLREYAEGRGLGRILYDGQALDLLDYIQTHDNLDTMDGFPIQVQNIHKWNVVEILIDRSIPSEKDFPDYNKGKIIVIH